MEFPALQKTSIYSALSAFGRDIFLPQGIFYWSDRGKKEADINATLGTATQDNGITAHLPLLWNMLSEEFKSRITPDVFGYAPISGLPSLREKWRALILDDESFDDISLPVVTTGISQGLSMFGWLFLEPGQTLLLQEKSWGNYKLIFSTISKIAIRYVPLITAEGHGDAIALEKAMTRQAHEQKKVVLLLNFPHNQTGFTPTPAEGARLIECIASFSKANPDVPFVVAFDDAYEGYVYDNEGDKKSLFLRLAHLRLPNVVCIKLDGASKQLLAYGLRVGFITFSCAGFASGGNALQQEIELKTGGIIRGTVSNCTRLSQAMIDVALSNVEEVNRERQKTIDLLADRWLIFARAVSAMQKEHGTAFVRVDPFNSGFFSFFNVKSDAKALAEKLIKEYKVACVPATEARSDLCTGWNGLRVAFCGVQREHVAAIAKALYEAAEKM